MTQRYFEDVKVGDLMDERHHPQSHVQIFRFSAVTFNSHRIHFDKAYATTEGYPDVLTQSNLHGAFLSSLCTDWMGLDGRLEELDMSVRRYATPGDTLVCRGEVTGVSLDSDGVGRVNLKIEEIRTSDGEVCARGTATVILPTRSEVSNAN